MKTFFFLGGCVLVGILGLKEKFEEKRTRKKLSTEGKMEGRGMNGCD